MAWTNQTMQPMTKEEKKIASAKLKKEEKKKQESQKKKICKFLLVAKAK